MKGCSFSDLDCIWKPDLGQTAPEPDVEAAWSREIARRVAELDAGTVETIR
jgi:Putative addiction module component